MKKRFKSGVNTILYKTLCVRLSYGYRKYRALSIIGYTLCIASAAFLSVLLFDLAASVNGAENPSLSVGLGYAVFIVVWVICAAIQIIPTALGIIGWVLTAKNNGTASAVYIIQTFLPAVILALTYISGYLVYGSFNG